MSWYWTRVVADNTLWDYGRHFIAKSNCIIPTFKLGIKNLMNGTPTQGLESATLRDGLTIIERNKKTMSSNMETTRQNKISRLIKKEL